jgi:hypothetical protein
MTTDPRKQCITCRKHVDNETDFNKIRAMVFTRDRIEGKHQIVISEEVHRSVELSQGMKETNTPYNEIIKSCVEAYKTQRDISPQTLDDMVSTNEED